MSQKVSWIYILYLPQLAHEKKTLESLAPDTAGRLAGLTSSSQVVRADQYIAVVWLHFLL